MVVEVVLVGCGNMGFAMLKGWVHGGRLGRGGVVVVEPQQALRERATALGVATFDSADALPSDLSPRLIILAVKPQVILDVAAGYRRFTDSVTFLSVAAGTTMEALIGALGPNARVTRCMPNTPAAIGKGMMVLVSGERVDPASVEFITHLLSASGQVATISDESYMDAVTAVSGSGPAYIFHFIECLTEAAEAAGLPGETAKLLAMQTVFGAASLAAESNEEPGELRRQVTSPNGTTAAALDVLMRGDRLKTLIAEAVDAARQRSKELGT